MQLHDLKYFIFLDEEEIPLEGSLTIGRHLENDLIVAGEDVLDYHLRVEAPDTVIGLNEPYVVADDEDNTIPRFGEARSIPHVLIEIRNDLIREAEGQSRWGHVLTRSLQRCLEELCL